MAAAVRATTFFFSFKARPNFVGATGPANAGYVKSHNDAEIPDDNVDVTFWEDLLTTCRHDQLLD